MALNIKNAETERLAHEVAALTGESLTGAIASSLREKLERLRRPTAEELLAIGRDAAARWPKDQLHIEHGDLLYDELGRPK
ncbi:type II toxin-antitoxin system VapB family antitoxin [uncultured Alsobacter sp.]|uniref:type II toxin-antitoxin system VapB family antitoxin n=1 Tax=uncultured Alsobacter sp. TaxID=1748258 RepID=UPI0025E06FC2|nr:type II toxin-antitoxin system VapB family antitoxin [uncultured Alsobacter sp.]